MEYEPVAYDRSIIRTVSGHFRVRVRMDDKVHYFGHTIDFERAQQLMECCEPDVWEGNDLPWPDSCHPDARQVQYAKLI